MRVFVAVYQFDVDGPTVKRDFSVDEVLNNFHMANLVIAKRDGKLVRIKDRYSLKRDDIMTEDQANRRVEAHVNAVKTGDGAHAWEES